MVRLIKKENSSYIKESKQVGDLYHVCRVEDFAQYIANRNKDNGDFNDTLSPSGNYYNALLKTHNVICFTRNPLYNIYSHKVLASPVIFQLVLDGDKISDNKKITQYNWEDGTKPIRREQEENVLGTLSQLSSFIKAVNFDVEPAFYFVMKGQEAYNKLIDELLICKDYIENKLHLKAKRTALPIRDRNDNYRLYYKKQKDEHFNFNTLDEVIDYLRTADSNADKRDIVDTSTGVYQWLKRKQRFPKADMKLIEGYLNKYPYLSEELLKDYIQVRDDFNPYLLRAALSHVKPSFLNVPIPNRGTLLYIACKKAFNESFMNVCEELIKHGADVNRSDGNPRNETSLQVACRNDNKELAKLLLDNGAIKSLPKNKNNLPDYITRNEEIKNLVLSYYN